MSVILGPVPPSDSPFMRRVRVHQAWYRSEVLDLPSYGTLAITGRPCGSVLSDEAASRHLNFVGQAAIDRYLERRQQGWGVDPIRCTKYLTSSQTLSFNMLAEAVDRPIASAKMFNQLLNRTDLMELESSAFEFAAQGTPYGLGDKTLLDMLMRFRTSTGGLQVVAIETKLADRFSTRRTAATEGPRYLELAKQTGLWHDLAVAVKDNRTRQLTRCHALAQSVQSRDGASGIHATLLVLTHPDDVSGGVCASDYAEMVDSDAVVIRTWDEYLAAACSSLAIDKATGGDLARRYVDLAWSQSAWLEFDDSTRSRSDRTA